MKKIIIRGRDLARIPLWKELGKPDDNQEIELYQLEDGESFPVDKPVKPATEKEKLLDNILYEISAIMMNSYMLRSKPFGAFEGEKIMEQLNRWGSV